MKKLAVAVLTSEESYGKALARGIAGESDKIIVKTACFGTITCQERQRLTEELINNGYIVVTDEDISLKIPLCEKMVLLKENQNEAAGNQIPVISSVSFIFGKIKEIYFKEYQREFCRLNEGEEKIIGMFSATGGCGCTVTSLTLARWISMLSEKPVLYVNASHRDDYGYYVLSSDNVQPKKQMMMHFIDNLPWELDKYCFQDQYGAYCFKPEEKENSLNKTEYLELILSDVTKKKIFSYIVIDGLSDKKEHLCDVRIGVIDAKDSRTAFYNREKDSMTICNRCDETKPMESREKYYRIPYDEESFKVSENHVEIRMDGLFSESIRKIAEMIIDEIVVDEKMIIDGR